MKDKFNISDFYHKVDIDGTIVNDYINDYFYLFQIKRPMSFFTVTGMYVGRPDLLSLKIYGKMSLWWVIGKVNNIADWWNDLYVEQVISIPDIRDIEDFYLDVKRNTMNDEIETSKPITTILSDQETFRHNKKNIA